MRCYPEAGRDVSSGTTIFAGNAVALGLDSGPDLAEELAGKS